MPRRVFFSFHYQRDVWRVNQIRNLDQIVGTAAAGFTDASLWEEAKKKGDAVIKKMIDDALQNTSVTVVCIGSQTAGRQYINYEIERSIARGNAIFGLQIHHLKDRYGQSDPVGATPAKLVSTGTSVYKYVDHPTLANRIETEAKKVGK
jgi:Thoeris protein ThsB, TIR-like domain